MTRRVDLGYEFVPDRSSSDERVFQYFLVRRQHVYQERNVTFDFRRWSDDGHWM